MKPVVWLCVLLTAMQALAVHNTLAQWWLGGRVPSTLEMTMVIMAAVWGFMTITAIMLWRKAKY